MFDVSGISYIHDRVYNEVMQRKKPIDSFQSQLTELKM